MRKFLEVLGTRIEAKCRAGIATVCRRCYTWIMIYRTGSSLQRVDKPPVAKAGKVGL